MSIRQLDDVLRTTRNLPKLLRDLKRYPRAAPEYDGMSLEQIEADILRRVTLYRSEAMDALYELATMPISESSGQNQVKLLAASRLYNETGDVRLGNEIDVTLRALNDEYHRAAPRIKEVRERTITFESESKLVSEQ